MRFEVLKEQIANSAEENVFEVKDSLQQDTQQEDLIKVLKFFMFMFVIIMPHVASPVQKQEHFTQRSSNKFLPVKIIISQSFCLSRSSFKRKATNFKNAKHD